MLSYTKLQNTYLKKAKIIERYFFAASGTLQYNVCNIWAIIRLDLGCQYHVKFFLLTRIVSKLLTVESTHTCTLGK